MNLSELTLADIYNNLAIVIDPEYKEAYLQKCLILEDCCEYESAIELLQWTKDRFKDCDDFCD
jgi:hypothetical protein